MPYEPTLFDALDKPKKRHGQGEVFDAAASEAAKREGMAQAADAKPAILELARELARGFARRAGEVTADDVQMMLLEVGITPDDFGPAAGSTFRGDEWEATGEYRKSARVRNHARRLMVWRLAQAGSMEEPECQ